MRRWRDARLLTGLTATSGRGARVGRADRGAIYKNRQEGRGGGGTTEPPMGAVRERKPKGGREDGKWKGGKGPRME